MATTDVLSLDEAQTVIAADNNQAYDVPLATAITAVTALLETKVGPIVVRTISNEIHPGWCTAVRPFYQPVSTITTVAEGYGGSTRTLSVEAFGSAVSDGYRLLNGNIERRRAGYTSVFLGDVQITYVAGRYATTATVDARFKQAAQITLQHNWGLDNGAGNSTFGAFDGTDGVPTGRGWALPNRALEILGDDRRIPGIA